MGAVFAALRWWCLRKSREQSRESAPAKRVRSSRSTAAIWFDCWIAGRSSHPGRSRCGRLSYWTRHRRDDSVVADQTQRARQRRCGATLNTTVSSRCLVTNLRSPAIKDLVASSHRRVNDQQKKCAPVLSWSQRGREIDKSASARRLNDCQSPVVESRGPLETRFGGGERLKPKLQRRPLRLPHAYCSLNSRSVAPTKKPAGGLIPAGFFYTQRLEAPAGFEPAMVDLQSTALATWPRRLEESYDRRIGKSGQVALT